LKVSCVTHVGSSLLTKSQVIDVTSKLFLS